MARYHGKSGVVYVSTTGTGTATSAASLSTWTLDLDTDLVETTSFGDSNKTYVQGLRNIQGTISGFWDDAEAKLFTASTSTDGCKLYLYPSSAATTKYAYGPAWLSISLDTGVGDAVTVSANFSANGAWGINL
jgi:hypothetical protein